MKLFLIINYNKNIEISSICDGHTILREKPFEMNQSLKKTSKLDIHKEMNLLEKKLAELQQINEDENMIIYQITQSHLIPPPRSNIFIFIEMPEVNRYTNCITNLSHSD